MRSTALFVSIAERAGLALLLFTIFRFISSSPLLLFAFRRAADALRRAKKQHPSDQNGQMDAALSASLNCGLKSLSPVCGAPPGSLPFGANLSGAQHGVQLGPPFAQGQGNGRPGLFTAVPRSDCKTGHSPRPPRRTGGTHGQPGLPRFQALPLPLPPQRSVPLPPLRGRSHRQPSAR